MYTPHIINSSLAQTEWRQRDSKSGTSTSEAQAPKSGQAPRTQPKTQQISYVIPGLPTSAPEVSPICFCYWDDSGVVKTTSNAGIVIDVMPESLEGTLVLPMAWDVNGALIPPTDNELFRLMADTQLPL